MVGGFGGIVGVCVVCSGDFCGVDGGGFVDVCVVGSRGGDGACVLLLLVV